METKKTILLHSCCGPCSTAVIERLAPEFKITIFYYNPNIYPEEEYIKRKNEELKYIDIYNTKNEDKVNFLDCDYESEKFYEKVKGFECEREGGARCPLCFELRLEKTARVAKEKNFECFGTTLSVSPHKNASQINAIGKHLEEKFGIEFLEADFKKQNGYLRSIELSKENNLYRQNYCGCEFALKMQEQQKTQKK